MLLLFRYANWSRQRHIFPPITFTKNLQLRIASFTPRRINKIIKMLPYTVHTKPVWADSWLLQILVSIIDLRSYSNNPPPFPPSAYWSDFKHFFFLNMRFKRSETFHLTCMFYYKLIILLVWSLWSNWFSLKIVKHLKNKIQWNYATIFYYKNLKWYSFFCSILIWN